MFGKRCNVVIANALVSFLDITYSLCTTVMELKGIEIMQKLNLKIISFNPHFSRMMSLFLTLCLQMLICQ